MNGYKDRVSKSSLSMSLKHEWKEIFEEKWLQRMPNYYRLSIKRDQIECESSGWIKQLWSRGGDHTFFDDSRNLINPLKMSSYTTVTAKRFTICKYRVNSVSIKVSSSTHCFSLTKPILSGLISSSQFPFVKQTHYKVIEIILDGGLA